MYSLIRSISARRLLVEQLPILAISFVMAELFYKFHSFTLECAAFLVTWYALDGIVQWITPRLAHRSQSQSSR